MRKNKPNRGIRTTSTSRSHEHEEAKDGICRKFDANECLKEAYCAHATTSPIHIGIRAASVKCNILLPEDDYHDAFQSASLAIVQYARTFSPILPSKETPSAEIQFTKVMYQISYRATLKLIWSRFKLPLSGLEAFELEQLSVKHLDPNGALLLHQAISVFQTTLKPREQLLFDTYLSNLEEFERSGFLESLQAILNERAKELGVKPFKTTNAAKQLLHKVRKALKCFLAEHGFEGNLRSKEHTSHDSEERSLAESPARESEHQETPPDGRDAANC